jgi:hypothetical protein
MQQEIEEFHQQAMFFFSVRQAAGNVVDVKFRLVFEHASKGCQGLRPQTLFSVGNETCCFGG